MPLEAAGRRPGRVGRVGRSSADVHPRPDIGYSVSRTDASIFAAVCSDPKRSNAFFERRGNIVSELTPFILRTWGCE